MSPEDPATNQEAKKARPFSSLLVEGLGDEAAHGYIEGAKKYLAANGCSIDDIMHDEGTGELQLEVVVTEEVQGSPDIAHGGNAAVLLDTVAGLAGNVACDLDNWYFTRVITVEYLKKIAIGSKVIVKGWVSDPNQAERTKETQGTITDAEGNEYAHATLVMKTPRKD